MSRKRAWLGNILKAVIVLALMWWMTATGKLSFAQMRVIFDRPDAIFISIIVWLVAPVLLGSWRWWLLIRGAGLDCSYMRALQLQLIGFFFNTAMPGAVGGDIVKAIYIVRDQQSKTRKTPAMLTVLLDRIVGLMGLFVMGIVAAVASFDRLSSATITKQLLAGLIVVVFLSCVFLAVVFIPHKQGQDPVERLLSMRVPSFNLLNGIYKALRAYREKPQILIGTIALSVVIQLIFMMYMGFIGQVLYGALHFETALLAPIFPFGTLITAIPLAPGGLGVGHAAFDRLFALVGLPGGANVFNIYVMSQLALNLLGVIPYLSIRSGIQHVKFENASDTAS